MQNPKNLTVKDVLNIIYAETWVLLYNDDIGQVVEEGYAEGMQRNGTKWDNFHILDIESTVARLLPSNNAIMINFCE